MRAPAFAVLAVTIFLTPCAPAQKEQRAAGVPVLPRVVGQQEGQPPTLRVEAQAVLLDVVVTAKDGQPVPGLRADDFHVAENGVPQKIAYFEEHGPQPLPQGQPQLLPPGVFTNLPVAARGNSLNIILLDAINTSPADQSSVMREVRSFLQSSKLNDPVAVFSLTSHLRLVHDFTTDSKELLAVLSDKDKDLWPERTLMDRQASEDVNDLQSIQLLETLSSGMPGGAGSVASMQSGLGAVKSAELNNQLGETIEGLQALARSLAALPGRKNLIWFADRFPVAFTSEPASAMGTRAPVGTEEERAVDLMAGARISVYPIAATGVEVNSGDDLSVRSLQNTRAMTAMGDQARLDSANVMDRMAQQTGGEAIRNHNDLAAALGHVIDKSEHYYTLSYAPTDAKLDGRLRRIVVKTTDSKYDLSYRRSYYAVDWTAPQRVNPLRPLMLKSVPEARQMVFVVRVSPAAQDPNDTPEEANPRLKGPLRRYKVDVLIPAATLRLVPEADRYCGRLEVDVIAWSADGRAVNWAGGPVQVNLEAQTYATEQRVGLPWHLAIDVPDDADALKVGVYDWNTGRAGTIQVPLNRVHAVAAQQ